jgi:monovalent cation:proton antiporter-2 (CPA2) family protein
MNDPNFFFQAFIYLTAAVLSVPISKRLGLGSVLGYLIAGVMIGPFVFKFVGLESSDDVMHFAEFGVVMMLFLVGLELQPSLLWRLRVPILGLGGLQVLLTALVIGGLGLLTGLPWPMALAIGLILAQSSTAIALQTLNEKGWMKTEAGQSAFSVLLFQDIAVIPILALLPLLAVASPAVRQAMGQVVFVADTAAAAQASPGLPPWLQALVVIGTVAGIIVAGRFLMRPVFRFIADTGLDEIFTATALLLVIAIALLMQKIGLSPALGTFVAGVVLADNEYRHELERDIGPFKSLLLGLFFISVGASIDFNVLLQQPWLIVAIMLGLIVAKFAVLAALGTFFRLEASQALLLGFALAQGGEFCFVLFSFALQNKVLPIDITKPLVVAVALSMAMAPLLIMIYETFVLPRFEQEAIEREEDEIDDSENPVIIAGFGRFGQISGRLLKANGYSVTILDHNPGHIEQMRKFGWKVFYGDASRVDLLKSAGAAQAKLIIVAIDDREKIVETVDTIRKHFPNAKVLARAIDRTHAYELVRRGIDGIHRETFGSALAMGVDALKLLGMRAFKAQRVAQLFETHDLDALHEIAHTEDQETVRIARARQLTQQLEEVMRSDIRDLSHVTDQAWDVSTLVKAAKDA